ncbi:MAG: hypothetical protein HY609_04605 [Deltaproteobacteria bacterium]|nr:hypothetical protein [Deltaproteobacteria bacterium]MBI4224191.1 hypothetical protein [Deltaproteobacteria bacterium]
MKFKGLKRDQRGQTATEYMLIIAVVVLGAVAGASILIPEFRDGVTQLSAKIKNILTNTSTPTAPINP